MSLFDALFEVSKVAKCALLHLLKLSHTLSLEGTQLTSNDAVDTVTFQNHTHFA